MKTRATQRGFSLFEICIVLATIALLAIFLLPMLAKARTGHRISCVNSLKQLGLAYRLWAEDRDGFPFASAKEEGSRAFADSPQVFRHFIVMSNELNTPKFLTCPYDRNRTRALEFGRFSNANLSYSVGLDANQRDPDGLLSGDRNVAGGTLSNKFMRRIARGDSTAGWTRELHVGVGNVGMADGSVQQLTSSTLYEQIKKQSAPTIRLAIP